MIRLIPNLRLKLKLWHFKPSLQASLILLICIPILISLGNWQMRRAQYKKDLIHVLNNRLHQTPLPIDELKLKLNPSEFNHLRFMPCKLTGKFINHKSLLLDNQIVNGKVGYKIITPFQVANSKRWFLIDRGWIQASSTRTRLPEIATIDGNVTLAGIINHPPSGIVLIKDQVNSKANFPILIQAVDYAIIEQQLAHPVSNFVIQLSSEVSLGISSNKHLGYAMQWFTIAITMFIYYVVISLKRSA